MDTDGIRSEEYVRAYCIRPRSLFKAGGRMQYALTDTFNRATPWRGSDYFFSLRLLNPAAPLRGSCGVKMCKIKMLFYATGKLRPTCILYSLS